MSEKVGSSNKLSRVGKPKFTLNLQQLKAYVYEGNDADLKMLAMFSAQMSVSLLSKHPKLAFDHQHYCPTGTVAGYVDIFRT